MNLISLTWIAIALLLTGYYLNAHKVIWVWPCWIACSTLWLAYAAGTGQLNLVVNNLICIVACFYGWYKWSQEEDN